MGHLTTGFVQTMAIPRKSLNLSVNIKFPGMENHWEKVRVLANSGKVLSPGISHYTVIFIDPSVTA